MVCRAYCGRRALELRDQHFLTATVGSLAAQLLHTPFHTWEHPSSSKQASCPYLASSTVLPTNDDSLSPSPNGGAAKAHQSLCPSLEGGLAATWAMSDLPSTQSQSAGVLHAGVTSCHKHSDLIHKSVHCMGGGLNSGKELTGL